MSENEQSGGGGFLRWVVLGVVLAVLAVTLSEGLRDRVLDALFGAEEEFDYTPSPDSQTVAGNFSSNGAAATASEPTAT